MERESILEVMGVMMRDWGMVAGMVGLAVIAAAAVVAVYGIRWK